MWSQPARIWNEISETQELQTAWAEQMFPLPQELLDKALDNEATRIEQKTGDPTVANAYLEVMPLLWERKAIERYVAKTGRNVQPLVDVSEAVIVASRDRPLTVSQQEQLRDLLLIEPK